MMEERMLLAGTISGLVFQDYNANGAYDTTSTIPNTSTGTIGVAVDRGLAGVTVTAYDNAGVVRGTANSTANGTYSLAAGGTGPYRVVFTALPAGSAEGPLGANNGSTVQIVPNGNSTNVSLGVSFPEDYSVDNPLIASNEYIFGDPIGGAYANSPTIVGFPYSSGSQYGANGDYAQPATFSFTVAAKQVGATFGLGFNRTTGTLYASSFTKRFAGYGPNAAGTGSTNGAIYAINPNTGASGVLADLNVIFGANTAGVDFRTLPGWAGYASDGGNTGWDAAGKTSLGGLDVSPDGSTIYVTNLADRSLYAIPTSGPINSTTVRRVSIPFNAPGATGTAGGTVAGDLRPFAVTYYKGQIYVGMVNSAESTQNKADLRAYVYTVNPTTLAFSAAPVFQTALNYTRGSTAVFGGSGNPSASWNPWSPTFRTLGAGTTASYTQPMLTGLAFDAAGNMTLGVRDRSGDQTGFFTNANPANPNQTYEGIAGGDTLQAFINTPGNLASGWTLESNSRGPAGQGAGAQNTNLGPGGGEFFYQQNIGGFHAYVASGGLASLPGFNNVLSTSYDPATTVRTGGFRWFNTTTGATDKAFQVYNTGFNAPPQSTFGKAAGIGDVAAINALAPIEIGDRVFRDFDGDGIQDPNDLGIAGVTVRLYQGNTLVGTAVTNAAGSYLFNASNVPNGLLPNTVYQIRFDNASDFATGGPLAGLLPTVPNADPAGLSGSKVTLVGGVPIINKTTSGAGINDHSLDAGFIATGSVSGTAFVDTNNDGVRQGGELVLAGVTLTLTGTDDLGNPVSVTTTTAANGTFSFPGLRPSNAGGYTIAESLPAGYLAGRDTPGNLGGASTPATNTITGVVVGQGAVGTGYSFGNLLPASLAGFAYSDGNNDGIKQPTEFGIAGVTVTLSGVDDLGVAVNRTTTTLGDGSYAFANLRPSGAAGYTITEGQPTFYLDGRDTIGTPGGTAGNDVFSAIVLTSGVAGVNNNFGELVPASLAGRVYYDANNDGIKGTSELGIPGVTVTLTGTNDLGAAVNFTTTTGSDGSYSFANLRPSNAAGYTITETQPAGYLDGKLKIGTQGGTLATNSFTNVVLAPGVNGTTNDFGELLPSSVGGFVYVDSSNDGIKQNSEAAIAGITVTLTGTNDLGVAVNLTTTTAADGSYLFSNLRPSTAAGYTITEGATAGFLDGKDTIGTPGGTVGNDVFSGVVLVSGFNGVNNNFGELQAASLAGSVFVDANNDGRKQGVEVGIAGVTVTLTGTNDLGVAVNIATTTLADGSYIFTGLRPGNYTLTNSPPPAYTVGKDFVGTAGGTLNGPSSITQIGLTSGATAINYFFGETGATISGQVYVDVNKNGVKNVTEVGLGGTTITLLNAANQVVATTTTAADGTYSFINLPAGNYTVVETQPSGYGFSTPLSVPVALSTAGVSGVSFGAATSDLSGVNFTDTNGNGTYDPGTDLVGSGVTITLTGTDINGIAVNLTTTTNSDGTFTFTGLVASNATGYTVAATVQPGLAPGTATPGTAGGTAGLNNDTVTNIVLGAGIVASGYQYPEVGTNIQGVVYVDANTNGIRDPGEVGVAGVTITLTPQAGPSFTTTTNASGLYNFAGFPAGTYTITETAPTGYGTTTSTTRASVVVPAAGITDQNFGLSASSLSGRVYNDFNNSGTYQVGEPGIGGVTINLRDGANALIATTTTAADGTYSFLNIPAGTYTIQEIQPVAYSQGQDTAGTSGGSTAVIDVISGINLPVTTASPGYNFGERGASIVGTVFLDNNANNAIDPGEGGLGGVVVQLLSGGVIIATATSAPNGTYSFDNLPAGNYTTHVVRPNGYGSSASTNAAITLTTAGAPPVNYGLTTSSLSGQAYLDLDNDGTPDPGEAPIAGVTITLIGTDAGGTSVIRTTVTDAAGNYTFAGLVGGTYSIAQSQPVGYQIGKASAGTSGGTTGVDLIVGVGLASATTATGYNFGSLGYNVSGTAFIDANRDGALEPGEVGLGGVPISLSLVNSQNQVVATTTTAPDGTYSFTNVVAGNYTLVETPPAGYGLSTPVSLPVTVTNTGVVSQNFGFTTSSIAGLAFFDVDRDSVYDLGLDIPGAGLPVNLTGTDVNGQSVSRTVLVGADGSFLFAGLLAGNYNVATAVYPGVNQVPAVVGTSGGTVTGLDNITAIPLGAGVQATNYLYPGTGVAVSGTVYNDRNRDGILNNGEAGVPGVTVTLTGLNVNTGQAITLTAVTNAAGQYVFPSAAAQSNTIQVVVPPGYASDTPTTINASVPLTGLANQNFGLTTARITGSVFADGDDDGVRLGIDPPLANVVLLLSGTDANGQAVNISTITAADGSYSFDGLNGGTYTITEIQPAGYLDGIIVQGTAGGTPGVNIISGITLAVGQVSSGNTFAELIPASLAGAVYVDVDNDGTKDPGEPGVQGVLITLTGVDDRGNAVNLTTTSRASGNYNFANLRPSGPGGYTISETRPAGYLDGTSNVGSQGGALVNRTIAAIELDAGIAGTNNNFAELIPATISGLVYVDANDNRAAESGEPGIGGVTVTLTGTDDLGNPVSITTTTGSSGIYTFTNLRPSSPAGYTVTETHPAGYLPGLGVTTSTLSTGVTTGVIVGSGDVQGTVNFAELIPSSLSGYVFQDSNNGGAKGLNEPGIAGVVMTLTGFDDAGNPVSLTATTDANGFYSFTNLRPSINDARSGLITGYTISEAQPAGYLDGIDTAGSVGGVVGPDNFSSINLLQGTSGLNYNFGELPPTSLTGFVYYDANNNGIKEAGETGIAGATVTLTGLDDQGATVNIAVLTAADGSYGFINVRPSSPAGYTLTETQPAGYLDGTDAIGTPGGTSANDVFSAVVLPPNVIGVNNNFGEILPSSLSGFAYADSNGNGSRGAGEPGLAGVVITLTGVDDRNQLVTLTTTTGADGSYSFNNLRPSSVGGYTLTETQPSGYLTGRGSVGSTGGVAGVNTLTGVVLNSNSASTENNFGNLLGSSLSGFVYFDVNNDGIKGQGEVGLGGITITLTGVDINGNPVQTFATTAADGSYTFANLTPGTYSVSDIPPTNFLLGKTTAGSAGGSVTGNNITSIPLGSGVAAVSYNFGETGTTIAGTTFVDGDGDGVRDPGEVVLGNVPVTLKGPDGTTLASTVSGPDGSYSFTNLPLDTYTVVMTPPTGYSASTSSSFEVCCCEPVNGVISQNLGLKPIVGVATGALSGFLYVDADGNGVRSNGDPALAGVTVTLSGTDSAGNAITRQVVTGLDGSYAFTNLPAGTYTIQGGEVAGYTDSQTNPGSLGGVAGNQQISFIPLAQGSSGPGYNFGKVVAAAVGSSISGTVYLDASRDGRLDPVDFGIANIPVTLRGTDSSGRAVLLTTVTDANGHYLFSNLAPGTYQVSTDAPSRFFRTGQATPGTAGGIGRGNTISQIALGGGTADVTNNFGEVIRPGCSLNTASVRALLKYGPNSTSVPASLIRKIGRFTPGGPVQFFVPTLASLTTSVNASRNSRAASSNPSKLKVAQAHPGAIVAKPKARLAHATSSF